MILVSVLLEAGDVEGGDVAVLLAVDVVVVHDDAWVRVGGGGLASCLFLR